MPSAAWNWSATAAQRDARRNVGFRTPNGVGPRNDGALNRLPRVQRLALEMSLHEESEQRALEGELEALRRDWREAEEIAAIADGELTPMPRPPATSTNDRK